MNRREERAKHLAAANTHQDWAELRPVQKDELRRQAAREGFTDEVDPTSPPDVIESSAAGRLKHVASLLALVGAATGDSTVSDDQAAELLGMSAEQVREEGESVIAEAAEQAIHEMPLAVEQTRLFEVVLGTGGPDDRLIFECDIDAETGRIHEVDPIRRVLYRYSWQGSAEIELRGDQRRTAEDFGRRVVPALASDYA